MFVRSTLLPTSIPRIALLSSFPRVTSPLLLLVMAALSGACYIATLRQAEHPLVVAGHQVALSHQYAVLSLAFMPIFFLAGAGAAVFWVLAASFVVVTTHASFYSIEAVLGDEEAPFDLQTVTTEEVGQC